MRKIVVFTAALLLCSAALYAQDGMPWMIGPFSRPASGNPVIAPLAASTFIDPIKVSGIRLSCLLPGHDRKIGLAFGLGRRS